MTSRNGRLSVSVQVLFPCHESHLINVKWPIHFYCKKYIYSTAVNPTVIQLDAL